MCGINAIVAYGDDAPPVDRDELVATRECLRARGPDGAGEWMAADRRVGLGHRRLAIIDLTPAGAQPMRHGDLAIVFNGEIYNYRELRADLISRGRRFVSASDTEVILQLYEQEGVAMLPRLRGMFAFALWDGRERRLLLARDPYGIKPLYYADDGRTVRIASQVRALVDGGKVDRRFDPAAAVGFFLRGTVPEPFSMYRAIRAVPAGSSVLVGPGGAAPPVPYFSIAATLREAVDTAVPIANADRQALVHDAVLESVRYHLIADVPVGTFLSAGIDSTSVAALATEAGAGDLQALTLRFAEYRGRVNDEAPLAAMVARRYGLRHATLDLTLAEFTDEQSRIFAAMDQPSVDGVNSYFISKAAAAFGLKVALSGTGGDELFGGYTSFRDIPRWMPLTSRLARVPGMAGAVYRAHRALTGVSRHVNPKMGEVLRHGSSYAGAYLVKRGRFLSDELPGLVGRDIAEEGLRRLDLLPLLERAVTPDPGTPYTRVVALESSLYLRNQLLRDMDWASMAHSIEVRTPLVDAHLLRRLAPLLAVRRGRGKQLLASAPRPPLPAEIRGRRKTGFTLPITQWLTPAGRAQPGKRQWARRVYDVAFGADRGYW